MCFIVFALSAEKAAGHSVVIPINERVYPGKSALRTKAAIIVRCQDGIVEAVAIVEANGYD